MTWVTRDTRSTCRRVLRDGFGYFRAIIGADAYDRYQDHMARLHPDEEPMSERLFWRAYMDRQNDNVQCRCC